MRIYLSSSLFLLPVLALLMGCASPTLNPRSPDAVVTLDLVPLGNVMAAWPPSIFVERNDGGGVALNPELSKFGVSYVPGIAILVVNNRGDKAQTLAAWTDRRWKLVLESEGSSSRVLELVHAGRTLPSYPRPSMVLEPGMKASVVVGVADCLPFNEQQMDGPVPICKMHVEYTDGVVTYRSNELHVQGSCIPEQKLMISY